MKNILLLLVSLFVISLNSFSQSLWNNETSGTNAILQDIFFVDQDYGWVSGGHIILHTTDGGNTWIEQPAPPVQIYYVDIFFLDRMNGWACGNEAKIIHTTDGGNTWVEQPNPYTFPNPILYSIYFANPDTGWAFGGDHGNYPTFINRRVVLYTTNGGNTWGFQYSVSGNSYPPIITAHFVSSTEGYAACEYGDIIHTSNGGTTWIETNPVSSYSLFGIYFSNTNTGWVTGEYLGVPHVASISKTTDAGITWNTQSFGTDEYIQDVYFIDDFTGWAVGGSFGGSGASTILHTTDGGENWESQNSPTVNTLYGLSFVDSNHGWAVGFDGTIITYTNPLPVELTSFSASVNKNDVTLSWQTATETNNSGFQIERLNNSEIDNTQEWKSIGFVEGHGSTTEEHNYSFVDRNISAGEYQYRLKQIDYDGSFEYSEIINVDVSKPSEFSLKQNYPNPFNPSTTIQYSIPESGNVKLTVYNSLGEEVALLVNEYREAGTYKINFDAEKLSNGVYYYRLISEKYMDVKKMILLK
jgi:photosystem II stability/assembly factor-like uncharacterized protein